MTIYLTIYIANKRTPIAANYLGARLVSITRLSDGSPIPVKPGVRRRIEIVREQTERRAAA